MEVDFVICDYEMPRLMGDEVLAWVIINKPELVKSFVFHTGAVSDCSRNRDAEVPVILKTSPDELLKYLPGGEYMGI